jgi:hypothetical protein
MYIFTHPAIAKMSDMMQDAEANEVVPVVIGAV